MSSFNSFVSAEDTWLLVSAGAAYGSGRGPVPWDHAGRGGIGASRRYHQFVL